MDYFFEISIIIFTAILTIIPFTGDLWIKKKRKFKFHKRGIAFIVFSILGLLFTIVHIVREINQQGERDSTINKTLDNTEKIVSRVEISALEMETKLARIDSLNTKLDSLNSKTINSINTRNNILDNFNELNSRISKIYKQEELKIKQAVPLVNILDKVDWEIKDRTYQISIFFTNTGNRVAKNFDLKITYFNVNQNNSITSHSFITEDLHGTSDLPKGKKLLFTVPVSQSYYSKNDLKQGYMIVDFNYSDFITGEKFYGSERFIWRSLELDNLSWKYMPKTISNQLDEYLKSNNIKLNK
ncbi:hypothetical protein [Psychroserpens algicola]|uniref:hypothetical protein n=1 Tax=Psychroserpens algicola TaxID=1719034 RepID=UPI001953EB11|nr:hypothetical protein [Psychroserpens algicola]